MSKKRKSGAHTLPKISEEMKEWSAALGAELSTWPQVTTKPMFGMTAFYRGNSIFAALPKTRAFQTSKGVAFRFEDISDKLATKLKSDARVITNPIGKRWITFEVSDARDLNAALDWLSVAYESRRDSNAKKAVKRSAKRTAKGRSVK